MPTYPIFQIGTDWFILKISYLIAYDYLFAYKTDVHESERSEKLFRKPPLQKTGKERRYLFYEL